MMVLSLFIIDLMGLFFLHKNRLYNIYRGLPTTNIIEPKEIQYRMWILYFLVFKI